MTVQRALLIHSGGFTSRQWRKLSEALASGFDVVAPDLLGYGTSGPWPDGEPFHFGQDLDRLESLLGDDRVHLIGHSYGGFLAMQLALRHPARVRSIAVYDPVCFGILDDFEEAVEREWTGEPWLRAFVDWWNGAGAWDHMGEETRRAFRAVGWKVYQEVMSLVADRTDRATYATITAPTLILGGATSPLAERRVVETLGAALPNATTRFLEAVGHMGPISHAAIVNELIAAHLRMSSFDSRSG